jgi:hypothetical protein
MSRNPETRILAVMKLQSGSLFKALASCPDSVARQAASLMYYSAELTYGALGHPGYYPLRVLEVVENTIINVQAWLDSGPAIIQAQSDISNLLMKYYYERDPAVLNSLQRKCAAVLTHFGLEEVPGIIAAIEDIDKTL